MIYGLIQTVVLTLVIGFSLIQVMRRVMPNTAQTLQARLARALRSEAMPGVVRAVGERLKPAQVPADVPAKGCGDAAGCGSCNMCGTVAALTKDIPGR